MAKTIGNLFAISDIHLSFGIQNKCMSIFKGWDKHWDRLRSNWNNAVCERDMVVIGGDISWGKTLEQAFPDLKFIANELNGRKIMLKGNHDYWWTTLFKMQTFLTENNINGIEFLHNNAYKINDLTICGTRGWINSADYGELENKPAQKILLREVGRLETSILAGIELGGEIVVFLHYPPIYAHEENECILEILRKYAIKRVFSGHIHSSGMGKAFIGEKYGTYFDMITADSLGFAPRII
ncbi:MAG: metallophosphoesterase [Oscillospiraceae bacterium]|nr:metallophosphoesterase [Oscillospiraceae bacterium]